MNFSDTGNRIRAAFFQSDVVQSEEREMWNKHQVSPPVPDTLYCLGTADSQQAAQCFLGDAEKNWPVVAWCATRYTKSMIKSFRHSGLKKFFETGSKSGIQPAHEKRLRVQLAALDTATTIEDMSIPGFKLHALRGSDKGRWSIWVNGNWRITFEFRELVHHPFCNLV